VLAGYSARNVKLQFVGAATTVTGSQFLLTTERARVLIDCGMFQGSPSEIERNKVPFPYDPRRLDALLLTHAHLDHCGLIPLLYKQGFRGPVYLTKATAELTEIVLLDSAKVQLEQARQRRRRDRREHERRAERGTLSAGDGRDGIHPHAGPRAAEAIADEEALSAELGHGPSAPERRGGERRDRERRGRGYAWPPTDLSEDTGFDPEAALRRQGPEIEVGGFDPLYDQEDARAAIGSFRPVDYDEPTTVATGVRAVFHDAGHILGSSIITIDASDGRESPRRIVFSGDLGRPNTPIIRDPTVITGGADYVLVESTYGGREHEPADEAVRMLGEVVRAVAQSNGVLLVPSFAIGRTQEVVFELDRLLAAGKIPHVPLYLDSPMAMRATEVYRRYPTYYDEETQRLVFGDESPLDYPGEVIAKTGAQSRAILEAPRPTMIVASNGMLTGGRVVEHFRELVDDPAATVLFVGYQGEGTLGAHLQRGAREVRIDGRPYQVRCQVRSISGFSAHADEGELLEWLRAFARGPRKPKAVFLVHGDPAARDALDPKVEKLGLPAYRPSWREEVALA
jgi:metallo-beta-lactamase family protein